MRVYLGTTADEVNDFLTELTLDVPDLYAPTSIYRQSHPEMDEEEIEYSLSLLAAEDALDLESEGSGIPVVLAFEVSEDILIDFDEISGVPTRALHWKEVEAVFTVGDDIEDLTWFAPQEVPSLIEEWLKG
jgi:hypothetical protein